MIQENINNQEGVVAASGQPFNPNNTDRIAELDAKFGGVESQEEYPKFEVIDNSMFRVAFGNATILKKGDGKYYAVRRQGGELSASEFTTMNDGAIGAVYQVHNLDQFNEIANKIEIKEIELLSEEEAMKIIEEKNAGIELKDKLDNASFPLMSLYRSAGYESFSDQVDEVKESIGKLSDGEQEKLAERFFEETIGRNISNNKAAYEVYLQVGGAFHKRFKELEDTRLKEAGYDGGFNL